KELFTDRPRGRRRELDLLAEMPGRDAADGTILVHVEVERRERRAMGARLLRYAALVHGRDDRPLLSAVVYLRGGAPGLRRESLPWRILGEERGRFDYTVLSLAGCRAEEYLERPEPLAWALAACMRPAERSRAELKLACLWRLAAATLPPGHRLLLVNCVETYLELAPEEAAEYEALRARSGNEEVEVMEMTWADRMEAKGLEKGLQQGLEKGREEGRSLGV